MDNLSTAESDPNKINEIKSAFIFGSFSRGDFNKSSDIDLFIFGDDKDFDKARFESKLGKEIQLFSYDNVKKLRKELDKKVIVNIFKGFNIKENIEPFRVELNA